MLHPILIPALQIVDCDYYTGSPLNPEAWPQMQGARAGLVPIVRMFGVTEAGQSIMVHVHCFTPYFYVQAPSGFTEADCGTFRSSLNVRKRAFPQLRLIYKSFATFKTLLPINLSPCHLFHLFSSMSQSALIANAPAGMKDATELVHHVQLVKKASIYGFKNNVLSDFLQVSRISPL